MTQQTNDNVLALDIGGARTGVSLLRSGEVVPTQLPVVFMDNDGIKTLQRLIKEHQITTLVVGYPRNLNGDPTDQSTAVELTVSQLEVPSDISIVWQDETLTSVKAEEILSERKASFAKAEVDTLAAELIMNDYISQRSTR